jgi:hypothetical protein
MQRILLKTSLVTIFLFFTTLLSSAQDLTGIWRGRFIGGGGDEYKLEFQVAQNPQDVVTGVSYSYLSTVFYGKATMTGVYKKTGDQLVIQEIRTVEVRMSSFSVACIMKYNLTYSKSGNEEILEGTFSSKYEKTDSLFGVHRGGDCGTGSVILKRVVNSDFYVEPFLREKPVIKHDTAVAAKKIPLPAKTVITKTTVPKKSPPVVKKNNPDVVKKNNPVVKKILPPPVTRIDSVKTEVPKKIIVPEKKIIETPAILKTRENSLAQTITVHSNTVTIRLYDNGEIDGDTISVYLDKQLVLSHKGLSTVPITLTLQLDEQNPDHEVVMVAENLGRIPPNTSLMIITAGDKRYQVQITSTEQKNALVRFKYEKPGQP